jgi:hypothetical protein
VDVWWGLLIGVDCVDWIEYTDPLLSSFDYLTPYLLLKCSYLVLCSLYRCSSGKLMISLLSNALKYFSKTRDFLVSLLPDFYSLSLLLIAVSFRSFG